MHPMFVICISYGGYAVHKAMQQTQTTMPAKLQIAPLIVQVPLIVDY